MPRSIIEQVGIATILCAQSDVHKKWTVADFDNNILPPLALGQVEFFYDDHGPAGMLTYAFISQELWESIQQDSARLDSIRDWRSGPILYFSDFIALRGSRKEFFKVLQAKFGRFGQAVSVRRYGKMQVQKVMHWFGRS